MKARKLRVCSRGSGGSTERVVDERSLSEYAAMSETNPLGRNVRDVRGNVIVKC
jgi:hypothetical protein